MLIAKVDKNNISIEGSELITSGSVKTNFVEFQFSEDWDGLAKTVIFQTKKVSIPVILEKDQIIVPIPWEAMAFPKEDIQMGVYGVRFDDETTEDKDEEVVLPTIWTSLGKVTQGVLVESPPITAPTKDAYLELLDYIKNLQPGGGDVTDERLSNGTIFVGSMNAEPTIGFDYPVSYKNFIGLKPFNAATYLGLLTVRNDFYISVITVTAINGELNDIQVRFDSLTKLTGPKNDERLADNTWFWIDIGEEPQTNKEYRFYMSDFIGRKPAEDHKYLNGILKNDNKFYISEILITNINVDGITCTGGIIYADLLMQNVETSGGMPYVELLCAPEEMNSTHDYETLLNKSLSYSTDSGNIPEVFGTLETGKEFSAYFLYDKEPALRYFGIFVCNEYTGDTTRIKATLKNATFIGNDTEVLDSFLTFFKLDAVPELNTETRIPFNAAVGLMPHWMNVDHRGLMTVDENLYLIDFRLKWIVHETREFVIIFEGIYPVSNSGSNGATFTPQVSEEGIISWTNNGDLTNPEPINIKGPIGNTGDDALVYKGVLPFTNVTGDPAPVDMYSFAADDHWFNRPPKVDEIWFGVIIYYADAECKQTKDIFISKFKIISASDGLYNSMLIEKTSVMPTITSQSLSISDVYSILGETMSSE